MATNNCEIYSAIRRPLDAFVQYFLDVKPYHTKLLEVLEIYNFYDTINVSIDEQVTKDITFLNKPLCNATGWGVDWDDACGFDAISCCDLFDCIGGYGLIYNNSDLLVSANIINTTQDGTITLDGNYTYDLKLPIKNVLNQNQFSVHGNQTALFNKFNIFLVIPRHVYTINSVISNGFTVKGDISSEVVARRTFLVYGSDGNDANYEVTTASYDPGTNTTTIVVLQHINHVGGTGFIQVASSNKNNGVYQVSSVTFNGVDTIVAINGDAKHFTVLNDTTAGSVQFRSGLIYPRHITIQGSSANNDGDYKIIQSIYDYVSNTTKITVSGLIPDVSTVGTVNLYGYEFEAGFEGGVECSIPKPADIHMVFSERLVINVIKIPNPTPSPTPTVTPTVTPSVVGLFGVPTFTSENAPNDFSFFTALDSGLTQPVFTNTATITHITVFAAADGIAYNCGSDINNCNIVAWSQGDDQTGINVCGVDYTAPWGSGPLRDSTNQPFVATPFLSVDCSFSFDPTTNNLGTTTDIPELNYDPDANTINGVSGPWVLMFEITTDLGPCILIAGNSFCF
jgi:hypothetical protein